VETPGVEDEALGLERLIESIHNLPNNKSNVKEVIKMRMTDKCVNIISFMNHYRHKTSQTSHTINDNVHVHR
jgi:hypothetical protein